jgi:hypothetical protein
VECYIQVGNPFSSSYPNHCFAWLFNYLSLSRISLLAWCLILIFSICFFVVKMILDLCVNYHREITPNTFCPWTIGTLSCGTYILIIFTLAIAFNCLISCQDFFLISVVLLDSCDSIWFCWTCFVLFLCR